METKHFGTLGAVVHVVKGKAQVCVRLRDGENFNDLGMVFPQQWHRKLAGQIYLDVALGTMNKSGDVLAEEDPFLDLTSPLYLSHLSFHTHHIRTNRPLIAIRR